MVDVLIDVVNQAERVLRQNAVAWLMKKGADWASAERREAKQPLRWWFAMADAGMKRSVIEPTIMAYLLERYEQWLRQADAAGMAEVDGRREVGCTRRWTVARTRTARSPALRLLSSRRQEPTSLNEVLNSRYSGTGTAIATPGALQSATGSCCPRGFHDLVASASRMQ